MPLLERSTMVSFELVPSKGWRHLRFEGDLETAYQMSYYIVARRTLRIVTPLLAILSLLKALDAHLEFMPASFVLGITYPALLLCGFVFGLTFVCVMERFWQPAVAVASWLAMGATLHTMAVEFSGIGRLFPSSGFNPGTVFTVHFIVLLVCLAVFRLGFFWSALLYSGMLALGLGTLESQIVPALQDLSEQASMFLQSAPFVFFALCVVALVQEQLARSAFLANYHLAQLQAEEHRKRVRTEETLQVLGGAIGGIVHDFGNPLTVVQSGADTLRYFMDKGPVDEETMREFTDMIADGAQMLDYLRLSLIEQTRIVEGKAVPVDLKPTSVRAVVEAGARYQKSRVTGGRQIVLEGEDVSMLADEKKMVTVLMNLIGNALKYSDGPVHVAWQAQQSLLLLAVLD